MNGPKAAADKKIKPDRQDYEAVEREEGPLPPNPSLRAQAERYRQAQNAKLIRLYEHGTPPFPLTIAAKAKAETL